MHSKEICCMPCSSRKDLWSGKAGGLRGFVIGCRWAQSVPHPPSKELKDTLYNAAFHDGAHGLHASIGMAILTTGD